MVSRHRPRVVALVACGVLTAILVGAVACSAGPAGALDRARPMQAAAASPPPKAHIVVNADTGEVLLAENEHEALPPASTAKVMTALTAVERLAPDAEVEVSVLAAAQPASRINMVAGHRWTFRDAMASMMMASANDAAYAIGETAGGTLEGFAEAMEATAKRLGMRDSTFSDPAGFDDEASFEGGPRMSAFDIAIATRNALTVPEIASWAAMSTYEFVDPAGAQRSLTNHNKLLPGHSRAYEGANGFKTGYTKRAGHTLTATATRGGCTLVVVVLDTWDTYGWATSLFDQAFATGCEGGTGETLPDVAVEPYARRAADRDAFLLLTRGAPAVPVLGGQAPGTAGAPPPGSGATGTSVVPTSTAGADDEQVTSGSSGGVFRVRNLAIVVFALLASAFVLRRRAVKRRRARRIAARRAREARMRSGGLTVVDGRYRTGMRVGPPVESHVRVRSRREDR